MSREVHQIQICKQALKFSAAHMTVFPDGTKEPLHGHNYATKISFDIADISLQGMISFSYFKKLIKKICDRWDEKVLLAQNCPYFEIKSQASNEIEFLLCDKRYILPLDEVVLLPIDNITSERLAEEFGRLLIESCEPLVTSSVVQGIQVTVEEAPGQGATYTWSPPQKKMGKN